MRDDVSLIFLRLLRRAARVLGTLPGRLANSPVAFPLSAGLAGVAWGLALARALAESFPTSPTFKPGPTAVVTLATGLVGGGAAAWLARRKAFQRRDGPGLNSTVLPLSLAAPYLFWPGIAPRVGWTLLAGGMALTTLLLARHARSLYAPGASFVPKRLETVFLTCVVLALYLRTLGPTVGQADTFEFQVVAPTLGVAHPTGYPLYVLSGKLFSLLPLGSVAWRVNLTSTIFGTAAVLVLYQLISRLTRRPLVAVIAASALAFSRVFWSQAVVAEVYALHNLFVAGILLVLLEGVSGNWRGSYTEKNHKGTKTRRHKAFSGLMVPPRGHVDYSEDDPRQVGSPQLVGADAEQVRDSERVRDSAGAAQGWTLNPVCVLALLVGLSFANHLTTALLFPAVALTILFVRPRLRWRGWLNAVLLFLLGLSLYLYIYLRWPMLHQGVWMSLGEFWRYVTGQQFGGALRLDAWLTDPTRYQIVGRLLREPFGWPGLILAATGLVWLFVKRGRVALVTLLVFLAYVWYALNYYVPDVAVFVLPAHLVLAIWIGAGMAGLVGLVRVPSRQVFFSIAISLLYLLPLWLLWTNLPLVDQSGEREAYAWGERVLELPLAPEAAILADSVRIAPLYYLQRIEGRRPDLEVLVLADEATYRAELETRLAAAQTVYLARFLPGLESVYHLRSVGPLTEVGVTPLMEPPALDRGIGVRFSPAATQEVATPEQGSVELLGVTGPAPGPDGGTGLTLYWRADGPVSEVYHVRLRLVDGQGQVWWQEDGQHAANDYYPTPAWHPGEVVADYHEIPPEALDHATQPEAYTVQVGLFRPFSDAGLVAEDGATWAPLLPLDLPAGTDESSPVHPLRARYSAPRGAMPGALAGTSSWDGSGERLILTGADLPDVVAAGAPVELRLYASAKGRADAQAQGRPALAWTYGRGGGEEAIILETWGGFRLSLQAPTASGEYDLRLGWVDQGGRLYSARCGWLARPTQDCLVAKVRVTGATATALANFDGKMLLAGAEFDLPGAAAGASPTLSPGQMMPLTLDWQGLQSMEEDYTVSVQLVGPDGRLYGQTDTWPVQGTFPTSQWSPGQRFSDPYQVMLAPDAAPGRYRVGVVVYLLATRTRLLVLDEAGQATGDIAWLGEFTVAPR